MSADDLRCRVQGCGRPTSSENSLCQRCWDLLYEEMIDDAKTEQWDRDDALDEFPDVETEASEEKYPYEEMIDDAKTEQWDRDDALDEFPDVETEASEEKYPDE